MVSFSCDLISCDIFNSSDDDDEEEEEEDDDDDNDDDDDDDDDDDGDDDFANTTNSMNYKFKNFDDDLFGKVKKNSYFSFLEDAW